ncbi:outer membrane protein [Devosia sp. A16]|uniref:outer membrane protein n=1 Tax=Devosia sp. A16 TaxID=1736675 RepID=UPI0006D7E8BD|nr:outer membrane protein [Devosia sp. A16]
MNKLAILVSALTICVAAPAVAADFMEPVVVTDSASYDWSGFYIGLNAGVGLLSHTTTEYEGNIWDYGDFSASGFGASVGATIGANAQFGAGVVGVEADINWSGLSTSSSWDGGDIENNVDWNWYGTLRARAGLAVDQALIYATAGAAFVDTSYYYGYVDDFASFDGIQVGLTAGVGAEYALSDNMSVKAEYLYIGLPTETVLDDSDTPIDFTSSAHVVRAGLNWSF